MAHFLFQAAYTPESWAVQVRSPESPLDRVRPMTEKLGGRINTLYYAFGEYDVIGIAEFPDDDSAAAWSIAAAAGGALKSVKTTKLLTIEQGLGSLRKAAEVGAAYHAPVGKQLSAV